MAAEAWGLRALALLLLATALTGLPAPETNVNSVEENTTLSTELMPPPKKEDEHQYVVFVLNLYGVKNSTAESAEEMFENDVVEKVPDLLEPLATVLLVIDTDGDNDDNSSAPVDLDEFAKELEGEGYNVERIDHAGETKVVRVKLNESDRDVEEAFESSSQPKPEKLKKVRRKRTICLSCKKKKGGGGGYGGGGCGGGGCGGGCGGGGCGGGGYGGGHPQPQHYPQQSCNTCGGGGGGGAYASSYATAQAYAGK